MKFTKNTHIEALTQNVAFTVIRELSSEEASELSGGSISGWHW